MFRAALIAGHIALMSALLKLHVHVLQPCLCRNVVDVRKEKIALSSVSKANLMLDLNFPLA